MSREVDVAIIGAGSAGLFALSQVRRKTDNFVLIDGGELGTTCARVGCMPSKVIIQVADDYQRRSIFDREGIDGAETLVLDRPAVMEHVQDLRDVFVDKTLGVTDALDEARRSLRKLIRILGLYSTLRFCVVMPVAPVTRDIVLVMQAHIEPDG